MNTAKSVLKPKSVRALFRTSKNWCKDMFAKDIHGHQVGPSSPNAVSFCLLGALDKVYPWGEGYEEALTRLRKVVYKENKDWAISLFNDDKKTQFKDIQRVIKAAKV